MASIRKFLSGGEAYLILLGPLIKLIYANYRAAHENRQNGFALARIPARVDRRLG
jgi:hypothetical protein